MGDNHVLDLAAQPKSDLGPPPSTRLLVMPAPNGRGDQLLAALRDRNFKVTEASCVEELLRLAVTSKPDVVFLSDDGFCNMVKLVSQVAVLAPQAALVVLFDHSDEAELLAVIHGGALGYLPLTIPSKRLHAAIKAVLVGEPALPRSMTATLVRQLRSPGCITLRIGSDQLLELSAREWDVVCLLEQGYTTNEIAERLFVCSATVRSHVSAVLHKLNVTTRDAALAAVFSVGTSRLRF